VAALLDGLGATADRGVGLGLGLPDVLRLVDVGHVNLLPINCQYICDAGKIAAPHNWFMRQYPVPRKRHIQESF
jgi:hypothetical protein